MPQLNYASPINWACPLNRGLLARWQVLPNWRGGITLRDLTGRYNGTLTGGPTYVASSRPGGVGAALSFDGTDDYISIPGSNVLTEATFSCWINPTSISAFCGVIFSRGTSVTGLNMANAVSTLAYTWNDDGNTYLWTGGPAITTAAWQFWCVSVAPTVANAYVGNPTAGSWATAAKSLTHASTTIDSLRIGGDSFSQSTRSVVGLMDDCRYWNRALSAEEVWQLYTESRAGSPLTLNYIQRPVLKAAAAGGVFTHSLFANQAVQKAASW